jgi:hypothetical protein
MSGMPLYVDDLPAGTVAVRVVRRSFANNVTNHEVELIVRGVAVRPVQASTDESGRATFSGLEAGAVVMARTSVDGEELRSQTFELPADAGVRVALVAGIGAGNPLLPNVPPAPRAAPPPGAAGESDSAQWWIVSALSGAIGLGLLIVGVRQLRRRTRPASAEAPASTGAESRREALFQELVALEGAHMAGRTDAPTYQERRNALIDELVAIDLAAGGRRPASTPIVRH